MGAFIQWLDELSLSGGAGALAPSALFAISVAVFAYAIFHLHRAMSVRNVLGIDCSGLRTSTRPLHVLRYCLAYLALYGALFPFLAYLWFSILAIMLAFLYNDKGAQELLLISMAVVTAVRVTAYYNADVARDIAKILPYGLLGIFLVNLGGFDFQKSIDLLDRLLAEEDRAFYYWVYISGQELFLRVTQPAVSGVYGFLKARAGRLAERLRAAVSS